MAAMLPDPRAYQRQRVLPRLAGLVGVFLAGLLLAVHATAADPPQPSGTESTEKRLPWTRSRVVGSPEPPPPYRAANAFPKIRFEKPLHITHLPGSDRLIVCEEHGRIWSFRNHPDATAALFADLATEIPKQEKSPKGLQVDRLYAIAFHPKFRENRFCYICYTVHGQRGVVDPEQGTRVSRFRVDVAETAPPRLDLASEVILLTFFRGGHNGCDLQFGPDGYLYISTGDAAPPNPPDPQRNGQDISTIYSAVLRIDVDRPSADRPYGIPPDNPFIGTVWRGRPAKPEIWAYGFRNPWRMSFDRKTGDLWLGDVGWESWEMIHKIVRGGNYGWSIVEGRQIVHADEPPGPTPILPPVIELPHTQAASIIGGYVYRGKRLPKLEGAYIFGDWETRRIWAARIDGNRPKSLEEIVPATVRVVGFGEDPAGELYFVDHDAGTVHTIVENTSPDYNPDDFPRTLSATGLFRSTATLQPEEGVYPFVINAPQWQDGAIGEHWIAVPERECVRDYAKKRPIPGNVYWHKFRFHFPRNTVLVKTLSLDREIGNPATRQRMETQLLHFDGSYWHGYSYAWREDQSDADLVPADGGERVVPVVDPRHLGGIRQQTWTFASRSQCLQCHSPWNEYALAFNLPQLNREIRLPTGTISQLDRLAALGLLQRMTEREEPLPPYSPAERAKLPRLANPYDSQASRDDRARAYLHVNCSSCHRFGGGGSANIDLSAFDKHEEMRHLTGPAKLGKFDLPEAMIIAPGDPLRSVLLFRMAKFHSGRMPHIGSTLVDPDGIRLIRDWIYDLGKQTGATAVTKPSSDSLPEAFSNISKAYALALQLAEPDFPAELRSKVLTAASQLRQGPIRDLFDGYLPQDPRQRKLGTSVRPRDILSRSGNPERGRALLLSTRLQCLNCHKYSEQGKDLGPDLSQIGKNRSREELLESLLEPSRRVEPPYQGYLLQTINGQTYTGLIVRRDSKMIILRDVQDKQVTIAAEDLERIQPLRESLMPSGLLADLTVQEAADLLELLVQSR